MAKNYIEWNGVKNYEINWNDSKKEHAEWNDVRLYDAVQSPSLDSLTHSPSDPKDNQDVTLTANGANWNGETNPAAKLYNWSGPGIPQPTTTTSATYPLGNLAVGSHHYTCFVSNSAGVSTPARVDDIIVVSHVTNPSLSGISVSPDSTPYDTQNVTLTATGVNWGGEDDTSQQKYHWTGPGISSASHLHDNSINLGNLAPGNYHYTLFVSNRSGQSVTRTVDVTCSLYATHTMVVGSGGALGGNGYNNYTGNKYGSLTPHSTGVSAYNDFIRIKGSHDTGFVVAILGNSYPPNTAASWTRIRMYRGNTLIYEKYRNQMNYSQNDGNISQWIARYGPELYVGEAIKLRVD